MTMSKYSIDRTNILNLSEKFPVLKINVKYCILSGEIQ